MGKKKKNKKPKRIGQMTNSRGEWHINPVTKVKEGKKNKHNRQEEKNKIRNGEYDD